MKHSMMSIGDWNIDASVDDDGHLTVFINHDDGTQVNACDADIASNDTEWAERFTTEGIEEEYRKSQE